LPPYSPKLKQLDYIFCGVLQEKIQVTIHPDAEALKQSIQRQRRLLSGDYICSTDAAIRCRLERFTAAS